MAQRLGFDYTTEGTKAGMIIHPRLSHKKVTDEAFMYSFSYYLLVLDRLTPIFNG